MANREKEWYRKEKVADSYDEKRFEEGGKVLDMKEKSMLLDLIDPNEKKILDIATGTGRFAELLQREGGKVVGLDASREMMNRGEADYVLGDAMKLPFEEKCFDTTVSMRFLHLVGPGNIEDFVKEVGRVTKDKFVFESLHPMSLRILYQWALPQNSRMYSKSFLKERFVEMDIVNEVKYHQGLCIPYGLYQCLPFDLAEELSDLDDKIVDRYEWTASTVYWELSFD